ncbi:NB-ARC [Dillenia turbinata]|uniref:NB-ARC n=1 Tax=Dillenia turbinata TaxID=194707 RepID=A0AAN8ZB55_9MAGN
MGDPLLAAHLQSLLDKLAPGPLMDFAIQEGFDSELRKWRSMLRKIKPVLGDAEQKQMNDREVKRWLHDLLVLAYDADDALDDLGCEALQQQNNSSSAPATSCSQLPDMLPLIKKITARFQDIEEQKSDLGLDAKHGVRSSIINKRSETTSLLDTSEIVGRENDVEAILKLMRLSETTKAKAHASHTFGMAGSGSGSINKLGKLKDSLGMEAPSSETIVIPIVGPGGVGKTTLAKCIYNHEKVENCFDLKVWACVSDTFDILGVTKAILEKVDRDAKDLNTLNALQERLKKKISWQSFLVVLDDIWTEKYEEWKNLFIPFKEGRTRSVVIVTTRSGKEAPVTVNVSENGLSITIRSLKTLMGDHF